MAIRYKLDGEVDKLFLGIDHTTLLSTRQTAVNATFAGFEGDKHAGLIRKSDSRTPHYPRGTEIRNDRQVSIVSLEELGQIASKMSLAEILPEWLGANMLIKGIPNLTLLPPSTRLYFSGGAVLVVQAENLPCQNPGKVIQEHYQNLDLPELFSRFALHLRGLVACVEKPAVIYEGEAVRAEIPEQMIYNTRSPNPS
jgi:MOSC domain